MERYPAYKISRKTFTKEEYRKYYEEYLGCKVDRIALMYHPVWMGEDVDYLELRPIWVFFYTCTNPANGRSGNLGMAVDAATGEFVEYLF